MTRETVEWDDTGIYRGRLAKRMACIYNSTVHNVQVQYRTVHIIHWAAEIRLGLFLFHFDRLAPICRVQLTAYRTRRGYRGLGEFRFHHQANGGEQKHVVVLVRLVTVAVGFHVARDHVTSAGGVRALAALVRLLARVRALVGGQMIGAGEVAPADITRIWFHARMNARVAR